VTASAATLFAVVAKTERGRARIAARLRSLVPETFPRRSPAWWIEPEAGVAIHAPLSGREAALSHTGRSACALALVGSSLHNGQRFTWPELSPSTGQLRHTRAIVTAMRRDPAAAAASWHGDCAFAFWDGPTRRLSLARDSLGQRGLFVREDADVHFICSELAPLMADPGYACQLDVASAFHYLLTGRSPSGRTLADGIARVPPAHLAVWQPGQPWLHHRFATPLREEAKKVADPELRAGISEALDHAIAKRLTAAPQALLLSGGVDSSYLAARGAALAGGRHFDAYTIEFAAPYRDNETAFARLVAEKFGLRHHVVPLDLNATRPLIEQVLQAEEPCAAWATVTHRHLLAHIGGDGHTELLSGLGSDEVFGGYSAFLRTYLRFRHYQKRWPVADHTDAFEALLWNRRDAAAYLFGSNARFLDQATISRAFGQPFRNWQDTSLLEEFYRDCRRLKRGAHWFEMAVAHECEHRIPDLLFVNFEPVARSLGLHTEYPFLDLEVVPLACGLGATERFQPNGKKWINKKLLREIAAVQLPEVIMKRPLASYSAPAALWLTTPAIARPMLAALRRSQFWKLGLVRREWLPRLEAALQHELASGKGVQQAFQVWALVTLTAWYDRWVEGRR
jgi:asparagine synthase (glutamine-hydrolysing)